MTNRKGLIETSCPGLPMETCEVNDEELEALLSTKIKIFVLIHNENHKQKWWYDDHECNAEYLGSQPWPPSWWAGREPARYYKLRDAIE